MEVEERFSLNDEEMIVGQFEIVNALEDLQNMLVFIQMMYLYLKRAICLFQKFL